MTLIYPVGLYRILHCDGQDPDGQHCTASFDGQAGEDVTTVRFHALQGGWRCSNPAPRRPARDLCPQHRPANP